MIKIKIFAATVIILMSLNSSAQTPPASVASSLQNILDNAVSSSDFSKPGAIMQVVVPGQWTWSGASGYAISGITAGQPESLAEPGFLFRIGSITKTMVATCIMKMEQEGLLSIDDPISDYLRATLINDTLMPSEPIHIRHLLNHTSGVFNSADNEECQMDVLTNPLGDHTLEEAIFCGGSQGEYFPAGFAWAYSNTNYSLLAMIIEEVSGISYQEYITQIIFEPLNLQNTMIPADNQIDSLHMGCYWNIGYWIDLTIINPTTYTGWADVVSTTDDLNHFFSSLLNGEIISESQLDRMKTIDPVSFDYGMGLDFYEYSGHSYFGHYGEVANTSGMFFADINSELAPNGYYISYNFNYQGAPMFDESVINLMLEPLNVNVPEMLTLKVYPNPASDYCTVCFPVRSSETIISLFDLKGNKVKTVGVRSGNTKHTIDLTDCAPGLYLITVDGFSAQKILIE